MHYISITYFITGSLYLLTPFTHFAHPLPLFCNFLSWSFVCWNFVVIFEAWIKGTFLQKGSYFISARLYEPWEKINHQHQSFSYCVRRVIGHNTHREPAFGYANVFLTQSSLRLDTKLPCYLRVFCFVFLIHTFPGFICKCSHQTSLSVSSFPDQVFGFSGGSFRSQRSAYHVCICVFASPSLLLLRIFSIFLPTYWCINNMYILLLFLSRIFRYCIV